MSDFTPTRSVALELKDERKAMRDGYAFLDEKCLLLAGEILRQLQTHDGLLGRLLAAFEEAARALRAAIARHGLHGLQVYPPQELEASEMRSTQRSLMGVRLQDATWIARSHPSAPAFDASPEAESCQQAFARFIEAAAPVAAVEGNLERLAIEYRRSVRRARALQDVLLPELDGAAADVDARLEELEQEDAIWMRGGA